MFGERFSGGTRAAMTTPTHRSAWIALSLFACLVAACLPLASTAATPKTPGNAKAGQTVFVASCGTCHTLKAAKTKGTIGPNLDRTKLAYATIVKTVTRGKSGAKGTMPPFKGTLSTTQIQNVAAFVYASTH